MPPFFLPIFFFHTFILYFDCLLDPSFQCPAHVLRSRDIGKMSKTDGALNSLEPRWIGLGLDKVPMSRVIGTLSKHDNENVRRYKGDSILVKRT